MDMADDPEITHDAEQARAGPDDGGISGVIGDLRRLADEARTFAEAEVAYQSSRAKVAGAAAGRIAMLGAVAAVLAVFALFALVMGVLLGLAALVGAWAATGIVVGALVVLALGCVIAARAKWRRTIALIVPERTRP